MAEKINFRQFIAEMGEKRKVEEAKSFELSWLEANSHPLEGTCPCDLRWLANFAGDGVIRNSSLEGYNPDKAVENFKKMLQLLPEDPVVHEFIEKLEGLQSLKGRDVAEELKEKGKLLLEFTWSPTKSTGHGMLLEIDLKMRKVTIYNSGSGLEFHPSILEMEPSPYTEEAHVEHRYQQFLTLENVSVERLLDPKFYEYLDQLSHSNVAMAEFDPSYFYSLIENYLKGTKQKPVSPSTHPEMYLKPQKSGTCAVSCVWTAFYYHVLQADPVGGRAKYKEWKFLLQSKAFAEHIQGGKIDGAVHEIGQNLARQAEKGRQEGWIEEINADALLATVEDLAVDRIKAELPTPYWIRGKLVEVTLPKSESRPNFDFSQRKELFVARNYPSFSKPSDGLQDLRQLNRYSFLKIPVPTKGDDYWSRIPENDILPCMEQLFLQQREINRHADSPENLFCSMLLFAIADKLARRVPETFLEGFEINYDDYLKVIASNEFYLKNSLMEKKCLELFLYFDPEQKYSHLYFPKKMERIKGTKRPKEKNTLFGEGSYSVSGDTPVARFWQHHMAALGFENKENLIGEYVNLYTSDRLPPALRLLVKIGMEGKKFWVKKGNQELLVGNPRLRGAFWPTGKDPHKIIEDAIAKGDFSSPLLLKPYLWEAQVRDNPEVVNLFFFALLRAMKEGGRKNLFSLVRLGFRVEARVKNNPVHKEMRELLYGSLIQSDSEQAGEIIAEILEERVEEKNWSEEMVLDVAVFRLLAARHVHLSRNLSGFYLPLLMSRNNPGIARQLAKIFLPHANPDKVVFDAAKGTLIESKGWLWESSTPASTPSFSNRIRIQNRLYLVKTVEEEVWAASSEEPEEWKYRIVNGGLQRVSDGLFLLQESHFGLTAWGDERGAQKLEKNDLVFTKDRGGLFVSNRHTGFYLTETGDLSDRKGQSITDWDSKEPVWVKDGDAQTLNPFKKLKFSTKDHKKNARLIASLPQTEMNPVLQPKNVYGAGAKGLANRLRFQLYLVENQLRFSPQKDMKMAKELLQKALEEYRQVAANAGDCRMTAGEWERISLVLGKAMPEWYYLIGPLEVRESTTLLTPKKEEHKPADIVDLKRPIPRGKLFLTREEFLGSYSYLYEQAVTGSAARVRELLALNTHLSGFEVFFLQFVVTAPILFPLTPSKLLKNVVGIAYKVRTLCTFAKKKNLTFKVPISGKMKKGPSVWLGGPDAEIDREFDQSELNPSLLKKWKEEEGDLKAALLFACRIPRRVGFVGKLDLEDLKKFSLRDSDALSPEVKGALASYLTLVSRIKQYERALAERKKGNFAKAKELAAQKREYGIESYSFAYLWFEATNGYLIRKDQIDKIDDVFASEAPELLAEMPTGWGKTKAFVPLQGERVKNQLQIHVWPASIEKKNADDIRVQVEGSLAKMAERIEFHRSTPYTVESLFHLLGLMQRAKRDGVSLNVRPETLRSIELHFLLLLGAPEGHEKEIPLFQQILQLVRLQGRGVIDECDVSLDPKDRLIYTLGAPSVLPERYAFLVQSVMKEWRKGKTIERAALNLMPHYCDSTKRGEWLAYLMDVKQGAPGWIKTHEKKEEIDLLRGLLSQVLPHALEGQVNENFGLSKLHFPEVLHSIPYTMANTPKENEMGPSVHKNPYEALVKTYLIYLQEGMSGEVLFQYLEDLQEEARIEVKEGKPYAKTELYKIASLFFPGVSLLQMPKDELRLFANKGSRDEELIFYFVHTRIASTCKAYLTTLESTVHDLKSQFASSLSMSATPQPAVSHGIRSSFLPMEGTKDRAKELFRKRTTILPFDGKLETAISYFSADKSLRVLIDGEGTARGVPNLEVAKRLAKAAGGNPDIEAVLFFDEKEEEFKLFMVDSRQVVPEEGSKLDPAKRITYYDKARAQGSDIVQAAEAEALLIPGKTFSSNSQAGGRMRQWKEKQLVKVAANQKMKDLLQDWEQEEIRVNAGKNYENLHQQMRTEVRRAILDEILHSRNPVALYNKHKTFLEKRTSLNPTLLFGGKAEEASAKDALIESLEEWKLKVQKLSFGGEAKRALLARLDSYRSSIDTSLLPQWVLKGNEDLGVFADVFVEIDLEFDSQIQIQTGSVPYKRFRHRKGLSPYAKGFLGDHRIWWLKDRKDWARFLKHIEFLKDIPSLLKISLVGPLAIGGLVVLSLALGGTVFWGVVFFSLPFSYAFIIGYVSGINVVFAAMRVFNQYRSTPAFQAKAIFKEHLPKEDHVILKGFSDDLFVSGNFFMHRSNRGWKQTLYNERYQKPLAQILLLQQGDKKQAIIIDEHDSRSLRKRLFQEGMDGTGKAAIYDLRLDAIASHGRNPFTEDELKAFAPLTAQAKLMWGHLSYSDDELVEVERMKKVIGAKELEHFFCRYPLRQDSVKGALYKRSRLKKIFSK